MKARHTLVGAGGGMMLLATLLTPGQAAHAAPSQHEGAASNTSAVDCVVSDPSFYNNFWWYGYADPSSRGYAWFREHGEYLRVIDTSSNGHRIYVDFDYCFDGHWKHRGTYDSGPNDGAIDVKEYNFSYKEGRRVRFRVKQGGDVYGNFRYAVS